MRGGRDEEDLSSAIKGFRIENRPGRSIPKLTKEQVIRADMIACEIDGAITDDRKA